MTLNSMPLTLLLLVVGCGGQSMGQGSSSDSGSAATSDGGAFPAIMGGSPNGAGGTTNGTGGTTNGTGGTANGTGGTASNTGGTTSDTAGTASNTGGTTSDTAGTASNTGGTTSGNGGTTSGNGGTASGNTGGDGCNGPLIEGQSVARLRVPVTFPRAVGQTLSQALPGMFGICGGAACLYGRYVFSTQPGAESDGVGFTGGNAQLYVDPSTIDGQYDLFAAWNGGVSGEVDRVTYQPQASAPTITIFDGTVDYRSTIQGCYRYLLGDVTLTEPVSLVESYTPGEGGAAGATQ